MTPLLTEPIHIAAIDAGSNAIRLAVARAGSPADIRTLAVERYPLRLGHSVFTRRRFDARTIASAAKAFRHFRRVMRRFRVREYRAVATSATREARNRAALTRRVARASGIRLEVISAVEESRLGREAVLAALGPDLHPRLIADLGGGSLEISLLRYGELKGTVDLPIGTVRLMESFKISGVMDDDQVERVRHYVRTLLQSRLRDRDIAAGGVAVACGGNAEALVRLAPGPRESGIGSINLRLLRDVQWEIARRNISQRMKAFDIRRDRAEVIGIAAVILATLGKWLSLRTLLVPGVGVREGVLQELAVSHFLGASAAGEKGPARLLLAQARWFARRFHVNEAHADQVRKLAVSLFDQLEPLHHLKDDARLVLELAALLHDVGHYLGSAEHHKHAEYLVRNADISGLKGLQRDRVACVVRYHYSSEPDRKHKLYASLDSARRREVRILASLLRLAIALDADHRERVGGVTVRVVSRRVTFALRARGSVGHLCEVAARKSGLFEREFHVKAKFKKARKK